MPTGGDSGRNRPSRRPLSQELVTLCRRASARGVWVLTAQVFLACLAQSAFGVGLAWDPSPDPNVVGYAIYYGTNSGSYQTRIPLGSQTNATVQISTNGATYYFVATAYTIDGVESLPSNEVSYTPSVTSSNQTITFGALPVKTFGDAVFTLSATASSGLAVSFSSGNSIVATVVGNTVTIVGAGSAVITASQAGNSNYLAATPVSQTLTVIPLEVNTPPVFTPTTDLLSPVLSLVRTTLRATDTDIPTNTITYSLGPNAPATATLDAQSGVYRWTPPLEAAGSSNLITVFATDNGVPPLTATQQFSITVPHFIQLTLGMTNLFAGQIGSVPVRVVSSAPWRVLSFDLEIPPGVLGQLGVSNVVSPFTATTIAPVDSTHLRLAFINDVGHELQGTQQLASLNFTAVPITSASVPLVPQDFSGLLADGTPFQTTLADAGRVIVIADHPILEALTPVSNRHQLLFYGNPGVTYEVQTATNLTPPILWRPLTQVVLSNIVQTVEGGPNNVPFQIYRAVKQ
jgi:hypothetical protein